METRAVITLEKDPTVKNPDGLSGAKDAALMMTVPREVEGDFREPRKVLIR